MRFLGHAKVVCPDGVVLATTGHGEAIAVAEVDAAAAVAGARMGIDHLGDRRPAAYAEPAPRRLRRVGAPRRPCSSERS